MIACLGTGQPNAAIPCPKFWSKLEPLPRPTKLIRGSTPEYPVKIAMFLPDNPNEAVSKPNESKILPVNW